MFASLRNFTQDVPNLRILNKIITEFDKIVSTTILFFFFAIYTPSSTSQLEYYKSNFLVEKIKIVGCTYMAASGLDLRYSGQSLDSENSIMRESELLTKILQYHFLSLLCYMRC